MVVCWFSAGISSFISAYIMKDKIDRLIYTHIDDQHPDTLRFLNDCENVLGKKIEILQSPYKSVDNVIQTFQFINSRYGAKCTQILKKRVRKEWETGKENLTYIWGYDINEKHRTEQAISMMPKQEHLFPLVDNLMTKGDCHGLAKRLGVKRPVMYDLGYPNNNCIGCVKGGMGYWNKIRVDFPEVFARRARQEREIGNTCLTEKIKGKNVPLYLDELDPDRGNMNTEIMEECSFMCQVYAPEYCTT